MKCEALMFPKITRRRWPRGFLAAPLATAFLGAAAVSLSSLGAAEFYVEPLLETAIHPGADVDSVAVWRDAERPERSLLFVTAKAHDRIEIYRAATGLPHDPPFLGGEANSKKPGQFDRPNAVWVLYQVPLRGGFRDILLTTEQYNSRVQAFGLPDLSYLGSIGVGDISRGHGLAAYQDGFDFYVFVADSRASSEAKIKKYRLQEVEGGIGAELVRAFGETQGPGLLYGGVESILADPVHDRLHVCGDEAPGRPETIVYDLAGRYTGVNYGDPQFEYDQEGIALYETGHGEGYLIIADQYDPREPTEFEIFDRATLRPLGHFESPKSGKLVTHHTDGVYLCQMPLPGFPNGAFYAVDYDTNVHIYDWTDIAEAAGLEIAPLDRPADLGKGPQPEGAQRALWYADGSWWAVFPAEGTLGIYRLEDGTFTLKRRIGTGAPARIAVARSGDELLAVSCETVKTFYHFSYDRSKRRYELAGDPIALGSDGSCRFALSCDSDGRAWIAAVEEGELRVSTWAAGDRTVPAEEPTVLGPARAVAPERVPSSAGLAAIWAGGEGLVYRCHAAGDPPEVWSQPESFAADPEAASGIASVTAGAVGTELLVAFSREGGGGAVWRRHANAAWERIAELPPDTSDPALSIDDAGGAAHLFFLGGKPGARKVFVRTAARLGEAFGAPRLAIGWPGVSFEPPVSAQAGPAGARDLVVAAKGTDGKVRFARYRLPSPADTTPPITFGHDPDPEAGAAPEGGVLSFRIADDRAGVDRSSVRVYLDGKPVELRIRGVPWNYIVSASLDAPVGSALTVRIEAADAADPPNAMAPFEYSVRVAGTGATRFLRGDANADGEVDLSDAVFALLYAFAGGSPPPCLKSGDSNDDGSIDASDAIRTLRFLFTSEAPLPAPYPSCGLDPTPDALSCGSHVPCA